MNNMIQNIFGKSRAQQDLETIVRLAEEKHELREALRLSEEKRMEAVYEATRFIGQRSPEDAASFHKRFTN